MKQIGNANTFGFLVLGSQWQQEGSCKNESVRLSILLSICPSVLPSICLSGCSLGIRSLVFSKFWLGARNTYEVVRDRTGIVGKNVFAPKMGIIVERQSFLSLLKNLVINFCGICSIMKVYINCCLLAQILYQGKLRFLRYRPKCSQPIRLQDF